MVACELSSIITPLSHRVAAPDYSIQSLATDSRRVADPQGVLFFAIRTRRNDGARYVLSLYQRGARCFVVDNGVDRTLRTSIDRLSGANVWYVSDVVAALQCLAASHRSQFCMPVIAITGSHGKTIVKDWLRRLLSPDRNPVASPRSYNSQIGVPLSVWQMEQQHRIAIFEAGISMPGEMCKLCEVIRPSIGILTNIADSHGENFVSLEQKIDEKLQLFTSCRYLIYCSDDQRIATAIAQNEVLKSVQQVSWGSHPTDALCLQQRQVDRQHTTLSLCWRQQDFFELSIPFTDRASVENAMHCITLLLLLGYGFDEVRQRCTGLSSVAMRLQLDEAVNGCLLINDAYTLDLDSLAIALDFMQQESLQRHRTLILSDFEQAGYSVEECMHRVVSLLRWSGVDRFIGIGETMMHYQSLFEPFCGVCYASTDAFLQGVNLSSFLNQTILLKGLRSFRFERIAKMLRQRSHETSLQVDLNALVHNLNYYRSLIRPSTKLMAMVKASAYGTGQAEVASVLQYHHVDCFTVAYIDEGVELRRCGITVPIMVMNPEEGGFEEMVRFRLEPDVYSFRILDAFSQVAKCSVSGEERLPVHVEVDTGMHRLGFDESDIPCVAQWFLQPDCPLRVASLFSHLACSEDALMDDFTRGQINKFVRCCDHMKSLLHDDAICCHILNSSGITRFPEAQMDMVRLGIGLYGISPEPAVQAHLLPVSRLVSRISQLKTIPVGESVGYNRRWVAQRESQIAILSIGYADGLSRHLGYGNGRVVVNGVLAPIVGSICMDMCFVDVTDIKCCEGDEVVLFGDATLLQQMASAAGTISYEILTSVSPRVKRVYFQE